MRNPLTCFTLLWVLMAPPVVFADDRIDHLPIVRGYADAMLAHGRDTHGPEKTGLLLSALDREKLAPLTTRPAAPKGIREGDRPGPANGPLTGANPQLDENLLRLLYTLSDLTKDPKYARAADAALTWFLENTGSPITGLLPWGEHLAWNTMIDEIASGHREPVHEFSRPWVLWDRCFDLAPSPCHRFAIGLWKYQVGDHETGAFDRHAFVLRHEVRTVHDFPRHGGFYIATWAAAYAHTQDNTFLEAIETLVSRFERKRHPTTGLINAWADEPNAWPSSELSLAIDCHAAADRVPEPLASRLRKFAAREDEVFTALPHHPATKGFVYNVERATAGFRPDDRWSSYTTPFGAAYGQATTGMLALMCVARHEQVGLPAYRDLIVAAADAYMKADVPTDRDLWPMTLGHAISTELAAHRLTGERRYRDRARVLSDRAVSLFFPEGPLPRASLNTDHYEAITGADTLAIALLELAALENRLDVVVPANTIDR